MPQGADRGKFDAHCRATRLSVMTADDFVAETPDGSLAMQRVTMTIDDELMDSLDAYMRASGHQNRSEAVRDLVRAGLMTQPRIDDGARRCMAALVYVYDHETRQLSKRLMDDHHKPQRSLHRRRACPCRRRELPGGLAAARAEGGGGAFRPACHRRARRALRPARRGAGQRGRAGAWPWG